MKKTLFSIFFVFPVFANAQDILSVKLGQENILSDKDLGCLKTMPNSVTFFLNEAGRKKLLKATSENIGKEMQISICEQGKISPKIMQGIDSETFSSAISETQFKCLQNSKIKKCK